MNLDATQTKKAQKTEAPTLPLPEFLTRDELMRLTQVLMIVKIPKSSWWRGIKEGRFPKPIKLGVRTSAWLASDIKALIDRLAAERQA